MEEEQRRIRWPEDRGRAEILRTFVWNPKTREFLGRTNASWAKTGLFYVFFYTFLALFFSLMMAVFYQTLDTERRPKLTGASSILRNVGLGFRPTTDVKNVIPCITYTPSRPSTSQLYVDSINRLLEGYSARQHLEDGSYYRHCSFDMYGLGEEPLRRNESCYFDLESLGSSCGRVDRWGYDADSPCVFLKVNKVIDWEPQPIRSLSLLPAGLQRHILASTSLTEEETLARHIWVWCESGQVDLEQPSPGIPYYYFPYLKQPRYLSPIIPIRVLNLKAGTTAWIQCKAWAHNIHHRLNSRTVGEVNLLIRIESDDKTEL